ncbi:sensor histidine kinase [Brevundimonas balnearis]|uniref:histidine kinase n=1 Tax=Brevundimonas balnearis TaxID=1572858 RepID=A0ABV6R5F2_9CAUL
MTEPAAHSSPLQGSTPEPVPQPGLSVWHAAWASACVLLALVLRVAGLIADPAVTYALLLAAAPGAAGLVLLRPGHPEIRRAQVLGGWAVAAVLASAMTGGLTGPLGSLAFMPLAAALTLGGWRRVQMGAGATGVAALAGLLVAAWFGPPAASPVVAASVALLTAGAAAWGARLAGRTRERRVLLAEISAGRAERILASQPGLTLLVDPAGRVAAAYGLSPPGMAIDPLFEGGLIAAVHAPDRPAVLSAISKALAGGSAQTRFAPRVALDRRIAVLVRPFEGAGPGRRLIVQAFDDSAQFAREAGLEAARMEAEAADAGKTRFLANMSHELRTPLNAVIGFADIMRQRIFGPMPDRYQTYPDLIHQAGQHLLELINDVLDVSKIAAQRYELNAERIDVRDPVSAAMAMIRAQAEDKGVQLNGVLPADPLMAMADRRALKQIALNLMSNAIKFTPQGGAVTVSLDAVGPYLELTVADTGVGIAPEDVKRLGRPFEQAGEAAQKAQGTGLGLSLVRSLAELHGGRLVLESTLGEGTAALVRLPVVELTTGSRPAAAEA